MPAFSLLDRTAAWAPPAASPFSNDCLGRLAASLGIEAVRLAEFLREMTLHGLAVDVSRFFFDPVYAYKRLALARATDDEPLIALTGEMFDRYRALEKRRRGISAFARPN